MEPRKGRMWLAAPSSRWLLHRWLLAAPSLESAGVRDCRVEQVEGGCGSSRRRKRERGDAGLQDRQKEDAPLRPSLVAGRHGDAGAEVGRQEHRQTRQQERGCRVLAAG